MSRELRHKNATGLPLNGKTQLQWVENWDVKVLWKHHSCCLRPKEKEKWVVSTAGDPQVLCSGLLVPDEMWIFSHIPVWRSMRSPWVLWGLRKGGVHSDTIPSRHFPMSLPLLPGHLRAQYGNIYGNLIPSRPPSLCQNWLKLANGLQSYFLWDWEGTDRLALKGT